MFSCHTGAYRWAAPERITEEDITQCTTKSSDIYALGCIMLEVLPLIGFVDTDQRYFPGSIWETALLVDQKGIRRCYRKEQKFETN